MRFLGADHLGRKDELERATLSDQAGKALRAAVPRPDPELHFRLAESCVVGCYANVAGHRQLTAAPQRKTVDGSDNRLGGGLDPAQDILTPPRPLPAVDGALFRQLGDVGAGYKSLVSSPREDGPADVGPIPDLLNGLAEFRDR